MSIGSKGTSAGLATIISSCSTRRDITENAPQRDSHVDLGITRQIVRVHSRVVHRARGVLIKRVNIVGRSQHCSIVSSYYLCALDGETYEASFQCQVVPSNFHRVEWRCEVDESSDEGTNTQEPVDIPRIRQTGNDVIVHNHGVKGD